MIPCIKIPYPAKQKQGIDSKSLKGLKRLNLLYLIFQLSDITSKPCGFLFFFINHGRWCFISEAWVTEFVIHTLDFFIQFFTD